MRRKIFLLVNLLFVVLSLAESAFCAKAKDIVVKDIYTEYKKATDKKSQNDILKQLNNAKIQTKDDVNQLRVIFADKKWDEQLFASTMHLVKKINKPEIAGSLILILNDEKSLIGKINQVGVAGKSEREAKYRFKNVENIIRKLGELKSKEAVPVLKEYLKLKNMQYSASEALGKIGDKSVSKEIREKAYSGEEINYGGLGLDEAKEVIKDLQDDSKKDKWKKIAKQVINIKDPKAKPYLKGLFNHREDYVREEAATTFVNLADENDVGVILEMTKSPDWIIKTHAIDAIKRNRNYDFSKILINMLSDPDYLVRLYAAKALGYKKIIIAVPSLEKSLIDKELRVRQEAFISLYILTGKKYDFEGKTDLVEWRADYEKEHPSFY